jgi:hypothetical protein
MGNKIVELLKMEDEATQLKSSVDLTKTALVKRVSQTGTITEFIFDTSIPIDSLLFDNLHHDLLPFLRLQQQKKKKEETDAIDLAASISSMYTVLNKASDDYGNSIPIGD